MAENVTINLRLIFQNLKLAGLQSAFDRRKSDKK